jgi:copper chaperone
MASVSLNVSGMTCDHCRGRVESAIKAVAGVYGVYVDLADGSAEVDFDDGKTNWDALVEAVKSAGYQAELAG